MENIFITSHEKSDAPHIYGEVERFDIRNLTINLERHEGYTRIDPKSKPLLLTSSGITIHGGLKLICPIGFNPIVRNSSYQPSWTTIRPPKVFKYLSLQCKSCPYNQYTLSRGELYIPAFYERLPGNEFTYHPPLIEKRPCFECAEGGNCDIDVRSLDNHYGYITNDLRIQFQICPIGYCCTKETVTCIRYDTCAHGRSGTLCGSCAEGFKLSFLTPECIPKGELCNFLWFAFGVVGFTIAYTATFIIITNIGDIIENIKQTVIKKKDIEVDASSSRDIEDASVKLVSRNNESNQGFSIAAFVQIVILYFQLASMLKVKYQGQKFEKRQKSSTNEIRDVISKIVNFRLVLYQGVCPSDDLTLPQKEGILFGMKMMTFCILIALFAVYEIAQYTRSKVRMCSSQSVETSVKISLDGEALDRDSNCGTALPTEGTLSLMNFGHRIKFTYIKLLKLYFTPLTKTSLEMVYCVKLLDTYHIFIYGDLVCYSYWQIAIITVILPGILLFPICFELTVRLLKKRLLTSTHFVAALACPYYALLLHIKNRSKTEERINIPRAPEEEEFAKRVFQVEEDLFVEDRNSLGWQVVQFYRTIIINIITIVIPIPYYRLLALAPVLIAFSIHDRYRQPYKSVFLNNLQSLSSQSLLVILLCNVTASISIISDISTVDFVDLVVNVCGIIEIVLYMALPLYLPVYKVWNFYKDRKAESGSE